MFVATGADTRGGPAVARALRGVHDREFYRDRGQDALLVIDDLTRHAAIHRQISLLLREPPGREAYPGDVFYTHARLLERAASMSKARGGGSLTALVVAETEAGNLSAYIPTNLISITDGQIYLEPSLFYEGQRPAVNVGLSVSRVGARRRRPRCATWPSGCASTTRSSSSSRCSAASASMIDERTRRAVEHGRRIRAVFSQPQQAPLRLADEIALLLALVEGVLDGVPLGQVDAFKARARARLEARAAPTLARIDATGELVDVDRAELLVCLREAATDTAPPVST